MQVRQLLTSSRYLPLSEKSMAPIGADCFRSATAFFFWVWGGGGGEWDDIGGFQFEFNV